MSEPNADLDASETAGLGVPSWILLSLLATVPVVFATGFSRFGAVKEFVLVAGVGLALALWGVRVAMRGRVALAAGRVLTLGLAAGFYILVSVAWGPAPLYSLVSAAPLLALIGVVVIFSAPIGRPVRFVEFALSVAVGALLVGLTGLLDLAGVGVFTLIWDPPGATGAFDAMEFAVAYYAVALPIAVAGTDYVTDWRRILFGAASVVGAAHFGLVADWTYFGFFVGAAAVVAFLVVYFEGVETLTVLTPIAALVGMVLLVNIVAASAFPVSGDRTDATALPLLKRGSGLSQQAVQDKQPRNSRFSIGRIESVRTMEEREYLAAVAFDLFQERPLIGHGPGSWWRLQTKSPNMDHPAAQKRFQYYPAYRSPHSVWSKIGVEYGVIGSALIVLWLLGCAAVGLGALGRSAEHADLIIEQWGLWTAAVGGVLFATFTPLFELAPAALVWFGCVGILTRRSAEVNEFRGSSQRWELGGEEPAGPGVRGGIAVVTAVVGLGVATLMSFNLISQLYRGWGDQLMLRTYYNRAIDRYEQADAWFPVRGGVLYNQALAQSRLGVLTKPLDASKRSRHRDDSVEGPVYADAGDAGVGKGPADETDARAVPGAGSESTEGRDPGGGDGGSKGRPTKKKKRRPGSRSPASKLDAPGFQLLQRALEMRPHDSRILDMVAQYYVQASYPQKALRYARQAVENNPNFVGARKTYATALQTLGKFDAAAKELNEIIERDPPSSERYTLHFQLARLYKGSLQEYQHAKDHFQAAERVAGNPQQATKAKKKLEQLEKKIKHERRLREAKPTKDMPQKSPGELKNLEKNLKGGGGRDSDGPQKRLGPTKDRKRKEGE